jgi:hypothetical protein
METAVELFAMGRNARAASLCYFQIPLENADSVGRIVPTLGL